MRTPHVFRLLLTARMAELERLLLEVTRVAKRQAAPFSRNKPKAKPKTLGRAKGHPPAHRAASRPQQIAETIRVPLDRSSTPMGRTTYAPASIVRRRIIG